MMRARVWLSAVLAGLVVGVLGASSADAAVSRDFSSFPRLSSSADSFDAAPSLNLPSITDQLKSIEEKTTTAAECVALCDLAAEIDRNPLGPGASREIWPSQYAKARYYDPFTARFTQADSFLGTIDDPPSLHRFAYANANPTYFTDPTGNYSWNEFKGDASWYKDYAGAFGRDITANAGTRLGNIGQATMDQAKALPGAAVDAAQETAARVHDVGVLVSGSERSLRSNVGQRSVQAMAEGGNMADVTQSLGIEQAELAANLVTGGGYNVGKESYLALQGTASQAEARLTQSAGSAVLAATVAGGVRAAPIVVAEARTVIASARASIGRLEFGITPGGPAMVSLPTIRFRAPNTGADPARRAYLNAKFGRSGDLHADINARGIDDAILKNAEVAAGFARGDLRIGSVNTSAQAFGTRAHSYFERLNNRLSNRVAGSYRVATEEFRDSLGQIVGRRSSSSIGADVLVEQWGSGSFFRNYDLKTYGTIQRPISAARQRQFQVRFGMSATEIFVPR